MNILLTGSTGFCGSHLADFILNLNENHEIYALTRWRSPKRNIRHLLNNPHFHLVEGDLLDLSSLMRVLGNIYPDYIWHGAAQSYVQSSFQNPIQTFQINTMGSLNLLEAVRIFRASEELKYEKGFDPKICLVSTSEVYGQPLEGEVPIKETNPLRPVSPYGVSKAAMDLMGRQYFENFGLDIVRTRMFSHEGSRRGSVFCLSHFVQQLVQQEWSEEAVVKVGNLQSVRTWAHIDDAVKAYWLVKDCPAGEVYNIGGKESCTVEVALQKIIAKSQHPKVKIVQDPQLMRPTDVTLQLCNWSKFQQQTGWTPQLGLDDIIQDLYTYWEAEYSL